jgi:hypothetical protein
MIDFFVTNMVQYEEGQLIVNYYCYSLLQIYANYSSTMLKVLLILY